MQVQLSAAAEAGPPGGTWTDREPSFKRTMKALFKKQFLIKLRSAAAKIEFIGACVIYLLMVPVYFFTTYNHPGNINPEVNYTSLIPQDLFIFFGLTAHPNFVVAPNVSLTHEVFDVLYGIAQPLIPDNITLTLTYCDTVEELTEEIYKSDNNGMGVYWKNAARDDALIQPNISLFYQSLYGTPDKDMFEILRRIIALKRGSLDLALMNISDQNYASITTKEFFHLQILVAFFCVCPCILATMPDFQTVLDEKDNKVAALSFLMGCSETGYWFVSFIVPVVISFIPNLLMCICFSKLFIMVGTSCTLMIFLATLFSIAHILMQLFLSTFMKNAAHGRSTIIVFLVLTCFFCYLHYFYTLDPKNSTPSVKHVFSILPLSCFQLVMTSMYNHTAFGYPGLQWSDINSKELSYPIYYAIVWLIIDSLAFLVLFLLFNLTNPRAFGSPLISWREIFLPEAWKRAFFKDNSELIRVQDRTGVFIKVSHMSKEYHGLKDFLAIDDVSFTINIGEVIVMIGPNGAGKSTLMNTLAGAIEPTDGTLQILGGEPTPHFAVIQKYLGMCFQENILVSELTIKENFEFFGAFRGIKLDNLRDAISFYAETLQLTEMLDNRAENLSGGQKRKLCIALSLLGNPPFVIMDEPTAAVDVQARQLIWKTISQLKDTTCIITSHALEEAEAVSSRLFIVASGKLPFAGTSTQLRSEFKCGYLLRVERSDGTAGPVLDLAKSFIPDAHLSEDRDDTIALPVDDVIPQFLKEMQSRKVELGINSYSFSVEQLEDMLLRLIQNEEVQVQRNYA